MLAAALLAAVVSASAPISAADVVIAPEIARPGDAVLVRVRQPPEAPPPSGTLAGRPLRFWTRGDERWAVVALAIETRPGSVLLELAGEGAEAARSASLSVVEPGFPSRSLTVAPAFVHPPASVKARIARDRRAFAAAYARPFAAPLFSSSFDWPRRDRTTGRFGDQRIFNGKKESVHYGLDIEGARGAPVEAANDGEVVLARNCYYSGNTVVIWHGADLFTLYFHLDRMAVRAGMVVKKGDRIGVVGRTGRVTGPHLHWSARVGGLYVDPESLLGIDFASGTAPPRHAGSPAPEPPAEPPAPATPPAAPPAPVMPAGIAPRATPDASPPAPSR